jgi:hypothetical protein
VSDIELVRIGLRVGDKLLEIIGRKILPDDQQFGIFGSQSNRLKILLRIVAQIRIKGRCQSIGAEVAGQNRVSVGRRASRARPKRSAPDRQSADLSCMALIASARAGLITATEPLQTDWVEATEAGPELMTLLCSEGLGNDALGRHLGTNNMVAHLRKLLDEDERPDLITASCMEELAALVERIRADWPEADRSASSSLNF